MRLGAIVAGVVLMWLPTIAAPAESRRVLLGLDLYMPVPEDNPLSEARVTLGRRLFFDARLSRDGSIACSTCHNPARAFSDRRALSRGVGGRVGRRNAPAILNRGYGAAFFWDGRAATLEAQVLGPIEDPDELGSQVDDVVRRLSADRDYSTAFRNAFARAVTRDDLARALASYVRSIQAGDAPVDRFLAGDANALSREAQAGLQLFRGKANCTACHLGPTFTDERFHNTGVAWAGGSVAGEYRDAGRFAVSGAQRDRGAFKTPTLREIARTMPYMHDGSVATLEDVIAFYDRGGRPNPALDPEIRPLQLTAQEKAFLLVFLRSLGGRIVSLYDKARCAAIPCSRSFAITSAPRPRAT